jgi:Fe-S oxidoreductase
MGVPEIFLIFALAAAAAVVILRSQRRSALKRYAEEGTTMGPASNPPTVPDDCLRCHGQLQSIGVEEFRVGGTGGGWKLLFGEWAELGEEKVPLEVYACTNCRRVELRVPSR